jgi:predicted ATPase/DNA-binding SARP family transcriptional activator
MDDRLELTLFGSPEVRHRGQAVTGFRSSKAQALLYYLAVTARPHTRSSLAGLLWGDQPDDAARTSLSKCLSNLRELVGEAVLIGRQSVAFNRDYPYRLDTERVAGSRDAPSTPEAIAELKAALALCRGDFLEGFYVRDAPDFEHWLLVQRAHFREAVVRGLVTLADFAEQQGDLPQAIAHTRQLLALEPWREEAHRQLITRLAHGGQRAAALAQYEICRRILDEELGVEPDAETLAVVAAIRTSPPDKVTKWQGDHAKLAQEHLPARSLPSPVMPALPTPPTPLIGRERERAELSELIANPQCRLITITGPGGIGKTRLALAAAADQSGKFRHGAVFVPLAGVSMAQFLPQAILNALEIPAQGECSPRQQVRRVLAAQEHLLVLDNYEHLLPAFELLVELLHYAPRTTFLVTSRERLALQAEQLFDLTGLDYPQQRPLPSGVNPLQALTTYPAFQLFSQRVRQTQPRFTPNEEEIAAIVRICAITEGMPLALELAAAAAREQSCVLLAAAMEQSQARLAAQFRDLPERHRSIGAVFEHSWRLLSATEQAAFSALSVFRGGFEAEAAEVVASAPPTILTALVDKSLLRCNPSGRYEMHELVRQYASEQLETSAQSAKVHACYTHYFARFSAEASAGMNGPHQIEFMVRVEHELDNLRAVLKWLIQSTPEVGVRMALDLYWLWQSRNYLQEGCDWLAAALVQPGSVAPRLQAEAYGIAGFLTISMNKIEAAEELFAQAWAFYRTADTTDRTLAEGLATSLCNLGLGPLFRGNYAQALHYFQQGLAVALQAGAQWSASSALFNAGDAQYLQGRFAEAGHSYKESLSFCDAVGNLRSHGRRLVRLGHVACAQGDLGQAIALFAKALTMATECQDRPGSGLALVGMSRTAAATGHYRRATSLIAVIEELATLSPVVRNWPLERKESEAVLAIVRAQLDEAAFAAAWAAGHAMSLEEAVSFALADPELT